MNAKGFLANFGHAANAPNGVQRLRDLVFHLAVSGWLVPKVPAEGSAEDAIVQASTLKEAYRAHLGLKRTGPERALGEAEQLFEIPTHWKWERLGNIACYLQRGKGPEYDARGKTVVVSQKCVQWSGFDLSVARRISDPSTENYGRERFLVEGDILWNSTGTGTAGRLVLYPGAREKVVVDSHVTVVRLTNFLPAYVWCFLVSPIVQQRMIPGQANSMVTGTTNQIELSASKVFDLPVPCPPIAEQKRIMAKVDGLVALCDFLATQQHERERRFPVFSRACHSSLVESPSPGGLNRIFDETDTVSTADLRTTIRTLAIRGKLTSRNLGDEPVSEAIERISVHKANISTSRGSRSAPLSASTAPHGGGFQIPSTWTWARFGEIMINRDSERIPVSKEERETRAKIYDYYGASGIIDKINDYLFDKPLLLIGEDGANLINRSTPIAFMARGKFWVNNHAHVLDGISEDFLRYIELHINAINLEPYVTGTAQPKMNQAKMNSIPIAFPPLAEQRRIVEKVDQLMALVDRLEAQQLERDKIGEDFSKACVAWFTGINIEKREKMRVPKIELVSVVEIGKKPKSNVDAPLASLLMRSKGELAAKTLWQQSGLTIDAFYQQLKSEIAQGWIARPKEAEMKVVEVA